MNPHDAIMLGIGALAGTLALLLMQGARSYGRRDVEGELVAALRDAMRYLEYLGGETAGMFIGPGTPAQSLAQARAALELAQAGTETETNRGPCRRA